MAVEKIDNSKLNQLKSLKYDLDAVCVLEMQSNNNPSMLAKLFLEKSQIVKEIVAIVLANEWDSDDTMGINTSQYVIKNLKHFTKLITDLETMLDKTTRPGIKQGLKDVVADYIEKMVTMLTTWTNEIEKEDVGHLNLQATEAIPTQLDKTKANIIEVTSTEEPPQHEAKETPTQGQQKNLEVVAFAKDLKVCDPGNVWMHNNIYKVSLGSLTALENNLLYSICDKVKNKKDIIVHFTAKDLRQIAGLKTFSGAKLTALAKSLSKKLIAAHFEVLIPVGEDLVSSEYIGLFSRFSVVHHKSNGEFEHLTVQVGQHFTHLLNALTKDFTIFKLNTFVKLKSKYAKTLFRLLERFRNTSYEITFTNIVYKNNWAGFCEFMGIPKSYKIADIESGILAPACKELGYTKNEIDVLLGQGKTYEDLRDRPYNTIFYEKHRAGRGGKIVGITFYVTPNTDTLRQQEITKRRLEIKKEQNAVLDKAIIAQKEFKKRQAQKAKKLEHYTQQEIKTLIGFCGRVGNLFVDDFGEHLFKKLKLCAVNFWNDQKWVFCLFEITPRDQDAMRDEIQWATRYQQHIQLCNVDYRSGRYLTYTFADANSFIERFGKSSA
ncbi:replication initiation protein [Helicobacter ailurogastricus]|uniref:Initiator Rep protein WH1 domain-containing protein n=1 Tax=Helicobacter ailurogastricus TaxID=1578720 RepID=A0A0K2XEV1_9HELI|nr:replication initiation protein [Helicobacter ailurogastricus]CRF40976.1 hypothetical protein HAL011_07520 [Helicobacter ailurogastricus]CRF42371.1 hypothetical protein HAL013_05410 [Helicobacter ailurogastricus]CRF44626.1 hypothetical protein HAL09_12200 [Helicobacter ailurogastricus]